MSAEFVRSLQWLGTRVARGAAAVCWLAGCGQVAHDEDPDAVAAPAAEAGARNVRGGAGGAGGAGLGTAGGGVPSIALGGLAGIGAFAATAGQDDGREQTLCDNEVIEATLPEPAPELRFFGTFDDEPTELFEESKTSGLPAVQVLHRSGRLESLTLGFAVGGTPYNGYLQVKPGDCHIVGTLFPKDQAGVMDFALQAASLQSTIVHSWMGGVAIGTLHAEFEYAPTGERHVLDGPFAFESGFFDSSIGL